MKKDKICSLQMQTLYGVTAQTLYGVTAQPLYSVTVKYPSLRTIKDL